MNLLAAVSIGVGNNNKLVPLVHLRDMEPVTLVT